MKRTGAAAKAAELVEEKMISMRMTKREQKRMDSPMVVPEGSKAPRYPWGLTLNLDNATLEKLGMKNPPPVGTGYELEAKVKVTASRDENGSKSCTLQVTDMALCGRHTARRKE